MKKITFLIFQFFILASLSAQIDTNLHQVKTDLYQTNTISGSLKTIEWHSKSMGELRTITIYEPVDFHKDSIYDVVIATDNAAEALANALEPKMLSKAIQPLLIIGVNNRKPQKIDSIFEGKSIDFRSAEMLGNKYLFTDEINFTDTNQANLVSNRVPKFQDFIVNEISNYVIDHYNVKEKNKWTLGGFSNGGFAVAMIGIKFPESFGYIISMSPAGGKENRNYDFDYSKSKLKFFICSGIDEESYYKRSIHFAQTLKENKIDFEHKTYKARHDYNMWLTYYVDVLSRIYRK